MHLDPSSQANWSVEQGQRETNSSEPSSQFLLPSHCNFTFRQTSTPFLLHLNRWSPEQLSHREGKMCEWSLHPPFQSPVQSLVTGMHLNSSSQGDIPSGHGSSQSEVDSSKPPSQFSLALQSNLKFIQTSTPFCLHLNKWAAEQLSHWIGKLWELSLHNCFGLFFLSRRFFNPLHRWDLEMHFDPSAQANWSEEQDRSVEELKEPLNWTKPKFMPTKPVISTKCKGVRYAMPTILKMNFHRRVHIQKDRKM